MIGPMIHRYTLLLERVEILGNVAVPGKSPGEKVGASGVFSLGPLAEWADIITKLLPCRAADGSESWLSDPPRWIRCVPQPFVSGDHEVNREVPWWGPPAKADDQSDLTYFDPASGSRRPLTVGDLVKVTGSLVLHFQPDACGTREVGDFFTGTWELGSNCLELRPYDWQGITGVSPVGRWSPEVRSLAVVAPIYREAFRRSSRLHPIAASFGPFSWDPGDPGSAVRSRPGYREGRIGHAFAGVRPNGEASQLDRVTSSLSVSMGLPPAVKQFGGKVRSEQFYWREEVLASNSGAKLDDLRTITVVRDPASQAPRAIRVVATVQALPTLSTFPAPPFGMAIVPDPDTPVYFQARYTVGYLTGADVHVLAVNDTGGVRHSLKEPDKQWTGFGDVEGPAGEVGTFRRVAAASDEGEVHVVGVLGPIVGTISAPKPPRQMIRDPNRPLVSTRPTAMQLVHSLRATNGSWTAWGDIEGQAGDIGTITQVAAAVSKGELHVLAVNSDGRAWHATRGRSGAWTTFTDLEAAAGEIGVIREISVGASDTRLEVLVITSAGALMHVSRASENGAWTSFIDVEARAGDIDVPAHAAIGVALDTLHIAAVNSAGMLLHSTRSAAGDWTVFGNVEFQAGEIGEVRSVALSAVERDVHLLATTVGGELKHTIRASWGDWTPFSDVEEGAGEVGAVTHASMACIG